MNGRFLPVLLAFASLGIVGCEPCGGVAACSGPDQVSYTGRVVERATGRSVSGTPVMYIRTGGIKLTADTLRSTSDGEGFFRLESKAAGPGEAVGTLRVIPVGRPSYDVPNLVMKTTRVNGDGGDLGRIVVDPFILFVGEVRNRLVSSGGVPFASVVFRQTGGIRVAHEVISIDSDAYGRFFLDPGAKEPGVLEGTITFNASNFLHPYTVPVRTTTEYRDIITRDLNVFNVGASLLWAGEVYRRASNEHVAGISVDFQRTGGIAVEPASFTTVTNAIGLFPIQPTALGEGELTGTVTIHPPAPFAAFSVPNVKVRTMADDTVRLAGRFGWGSQVFGAAEFRYRTTMQPVSPGALMIFRRTGGVGVHPDTFADRTNQFGFAKVELPSDRAGEVVGDIELRLGEPYGTEVIRGKRLASVEDDVMHFFGTHLVGRWFPQVAQVADSITGKAIPGARVTFTRTDGVHFSPDPYVVTPNSDGYFAIRPQPFEDGEVVGNLTFELPSPYASVTIRGLHLQTSMDDTLRFVGSFLFAPRR